MPAPVGEENIKGAEARVKELVVGLRERDYLLEARQGLRQVRRPSPLPVSSKLRLQPANAGRLTLDQQFAGSAPYPQPRP